LANSLLVVKAMREPTEKSCIKFRKSRLEIVISL
jgi:hypothetical protein